MPGGIDASDTTGKGHPPGRATCPRPIRPSDQRGRTHSSQIDEQAATAASTLCNQGSFTASWHCPRQRGGTDGARFASPHMTASLALAMGLTPRSASFGLSVDGTASPQVALRLGFEMLRGLSAGFFRIDFVRDPRLRCPLPCWGLSSATAGFRIRPVGIRDLCFISRCRRMLEKSNFQKINLKSRWFGPIS